MLERSDNTPQPDASRQGSGTTEASDGSPPLRIWRDCAMPYIALSGLAIAQPVLTLTGRHATTFIFAGASRSHVLAYALIVVFAPTLFLLAVTAAANRLSATAGRAARTGSFAILFTLLGMAVAAQAGAGHPVDLAIALGFGAAATALLLRSPAVAEVVRLLTVVPMIFLAVFVFASGTTPLIMASAADPIELESAADAPPVIVLILDELPIAPFLNPDGSGELNTELLPNFARLSDQSHWYPNALSNAYETVQSLPVAITGTYEGGLASFHQQHKTVFAAMEAEYVTHTREPITLFCPPRECAADTDESQFAPLGRLLQDSGVLLTQAIGPEIARDAIPPIDSGWGGFLDDGPSLAARSDDGQTTGIDIGRDRDERPTPKPGAALTWVGDVAGLGDEVAQVVEDNGTAAANFWWHHVPAPHAPWRVLPSGRHYATTEPGLFAMDGLDYAWADNDALLRIQRQRQLTQILAIDGELGELIDSLEASGAWDDALLVVMADHGSAFDADNPRRDVTDATAPDVYRVPLFIHEPGQAAGTTTTEPVFLADIAPTILGFTGIDPGWEIEGVDLLIDGPPPGREHRAITPACCREGGVSSDISELQPLAAAQFEALGSVTDQFDLFEAGPHADLIGRNIDEVLESNDASIVAAWEPDQTDALTNVELDDGIVPAYLSGPAPHDGLAAGTELLVAINSVISGSAYSDPDSAVDRIVGFAAEPSFRDGPNDVRVLWTEDGEWFATETSPWVPEELRGQPAVTWGEPAPFVDVVAAELDGDEWVLQVQASDDAGNPPGTLEATVGGEQLDPASMSRPPLPAASEAAESLTELRVAADLVSEAGTTILVTASFGEVVVTDAAHTTG